MRLRPPKSETELLDRCNEIAGRTLAQLAADRSVTVPPDQRRNKGWVGQFIEMCLGATAGSKAEPDFQAIGVEMKATPT